MVPLLRVWSTIWTTTSRALSAFFHPPLRNQVKMTTYWFKKTLMHWSWNECPHSKVAQLSSSKTSRQIEHSHTWLLISCGGSSVWQINKDGKNIHIRIRIWFLGRIRKKLSHLIFSTSAQVQVKERLHWSHNLFLWHSSERTLNSNGNFFSKQGLVSIYVSVPCVDFWLLQNSNLPNWWSSWRSCCKATVAFPPFLSWLQEPGQQSHQQPPRQPELLG